MYSKLILNLIFFLFRNYFSFSKKNSFILAIFVFTSIIYTVCKCDEIIVVTGPILSELQIRDSLDWSIELDAKAIKEDWYIGKDIKSCGNCIVSHFVIKTKRKNSFYYCNVYLDTNMLGIITPSNVFNTANNVIPCIFPDNDVCTLFVKYSLLNETPKQIEHFIRCGFAQINNINGKHSLVSCPLNFSHFIISNTPSIGIANKKNNIVKIFFHDSQYKPINSGVLLNGNGPDVNGNVFLSITSCDSVLLKCEALAPNLDFGNNGAATVLFTPEADTIPIDILVKGVAKNAQCSNNYKAGNFKIISKYRNIYRLYLPFLYNSGNIELSISNLKGETIPLKLHAFPKDNKIDIFFEDNVKIAAGIYILYLNISANYYSFKINCT